MAARRFTPGASQTLFVLDIVAVMLMWPAVVLMCLPREVPAIDLIVFPLGYIGALYAFGLYRRDALLETTRSISRLPLATLAGALAGVAVRWALCRVLWPDAPASAGTGAFAASVLAMGGAGVMARAILFLLLRSGALRRRVLVVGAGTRAWDLWFMLQREGGRLRDEVRFLHHPSLGARDDRLPDAMVWTCETFDVARVARVVHADLVVIAPDERRGMDLHRLLACKRIGMPVLEYLSFVEKEIRRLDLKRMELSWIVFSDGFRFNGLDRVLKRGFDVFAASAVLLPALPFLVAGIVAVRLGGPGPVFYRQERVTRDGRTFQILKLRTMRVDAEAGRAVWAADADPRITKAGRLLRRIRVDELPQLLNVLRGDMSFVGPRPERPVFVDELATKLPLYHERHMVKAGLTGWAQVNYPYGASVDDARSKLSYDLYYVKHASVLFDALILLQTVRVLLWPSGVR